MDGPPSRVVYDSMIKNLELACELGRQVRFIK
jgi:hypothetical protein